MSPGLSAMLTGLEVRSGDVRERAKSEAGTGVVIILAKH